MTRFNVSAVRLRHGEQAERRLAVALEPLQYAGERYEPRPEAPEVTLTLSRLSSGHLFELRFIVELAGPCVRCLKQAVLPLSLAGREYEAQSPDDPDEQRPPYLEGDQLDISAWARDLVALALPGKILCRDDCAGLCPRCGTDHNLGPCACPPAAADSRWSALEQLRDEL